MMQLKMFADLQSRHNTALLPSWFRSLVIDKTITNNFTQSSMAYITFDSRTNVIRGPGIEIEVLRTSVFSAICPPPMNLNIQQVQFIDQSNTKLLVIHLYSYTKQFKKYYAYYLLLFISRTLLSFYVFVCNLLKIRFVHRQN